MGSLFILAGFSIIGGCGLREVPDIAKARTKEERKRPVGRLLGGLCFGCVVAALGFAGYWVARSFRGTGVEVCENGLRQWPPKPDSVSSLWGELIRIEDHYDYVKVPMKLGGPLLSESYRTIVVVCLNEKRIVCDRQSVTAVGRLAKRLRAVASAHSIPWLVIKGPGADGPQGYAEDVTDVLSD